MDSVLVNYVYVYSAHDRWSVALGLIAEGTCSGALTYLPMQKREKITPSRSSAVNSPVIADSARCASASSSANSSSGGDRASRWSQRARQMLVGAPQRDEVALARDEAVLAGRLHTRAREHLRLRARPRLRRSAPRSRHARRRRAARSAKAGPRDRSCCARRAAALRREAARAARDRRRAARCDCARASTSSSVRSARAIAACVRSTPMRSTGSSVSRSPAVSTIVSGMPPISTGRSTGSRVVPAMAVTIAASSRTSRLSRLDLPTFGRPASTTVRPCDRRRPVRARASSATASRAAPAAAHRVFAARTKSRSSSGKSSDASVCMRSSVTRRDDARARARRTRPSGCASPHAQQRRWPIR